MEARQGGLRYGLLSSTPGVIPTLSPSHVGAIYEEIGPILKRIHSVTFDAFGYVTTEVLDPHPTNEVYMRFQFRKKLRESDEIGGPAPVRERIEAFLNVGRCSRRAGRRSCATTTSMS